MLPAQIRRLHARLMVLQDPDDLLFRVPTLLILSSRSDYEEFSLAEFSGGRSVADCLGLFAFVRVGEPRGCGRRVCRARDGPTSSR